MLCERCHERPATVHVTKIINGEKTGYHLCEVCAKEQGEVMNPFLAGNAFDFNKLLSGLLSMDSSPGFAPVQAQVQPRCGTCGMTYNQFTQVGRFGCPDCYDSFAARLEPLLRRIQTGNRHTGKVPVKSGAKIKRLRQLDALRRELQQAVAQEQFERAAELRDQIRMLEQTSE
ncbi:protein-arginine kinase activator protein [Alicyclobacillus hesperidum]|uniref:Protein-arginine kinase activator protein n=1 Tax=Alicyclobacillus hesperidum TaxID=89784 RepID=A0A1H2VGT5_9BACL|nr:UvrB/UvrC motif-containing protein [Alicyclobacillus hesperidum]GLV12891.1 protein-arginine kinase activator protein [Alicyclobacillus hesperidum]SDW67522.1 Protein-arginine kinase activator protein McsA [Alicyclobacillus hesperidum]